MLNAPHNFRSIKAGTFDDTVPRADRVGMIAAGNPDVLREAMGLESYAGKRKRGGRVKLGAIGGAHARRRLDRRSRRPKKFETGGAADAGVSFGNGRSVCLGLERGPRTYGCGRWCRW